LEFAQHLLSQAKAHRKLREYALKKRSRTNQDFAKEFKICVLFIFILDILSKLDSRNRVMGFTLTHTFYLSSRLQKAFSKIISYLDLDPTCFSS